MSTIVVGYVPTPEGHAALDRAIQEASTHGAKLVVVNIVHTGSYVDKEAVQSQELTELDERLATAGIDHEVRRPETGRDAGETLLEIADSEDVDMLVIGMRHRSPLGKLLLGSTAQHILLAATCPVLTVKAVG